SSGKIVGTIDYLAPEQIRDPLDVSPMWDIYSLGCTFYYALTGKVPFPGGSVQDKARRHRDEPPLHPHRFNPDIDRDLVDVIAEMMEKNPEKRIQSAAEIVARLEPWVSDNRQFELNQTIQPAWQPPPPVYANAGHLNDTEAGSNAYEVSQDDSPSQTSQSTEQSLFASQDTQAIQSSNSRISFQPRQTRRERQLTLALLIGLPLSAILGAIVTYVSMVAR
ncbi:MAG: serine/threonine protein kinase, partial [Blastopirellula sp. JB062]